MTEAATHFARATDRIDAVMRRLGPVLPMPAPVIKGPPHGPATPLSTTLKPQ